MSRQLGKKQKKVSHRVTPFDRFLDGTERFYIQTSGKSIDIWAFIIAAVGPNALTETDEREQQLRQVNAARVNNKIGSADTQLALSTEATVTEVPDEKGDGGGIPGCMPGGMGMGM
jgi:hypothetical protein